VYGFLCVILFSPFESIQINLEENMKAALKFLNKFAAASSKHAISRSFSSYEISYK